MSRVDRGAIGRRPMSASSSSGVGTRSSSRARRDAAATTASDMASMTTAGVNTESESDTTADIGVAPIPSTPGKVVGEGREGKKAVKRAKAKPVLSGGTRIRRSTAGSTSIASAKAKSGPAKSRPGPAPAGVTKTSSGRIVKRNAKYFSTREDPPAATVTGNGRRKGGDGAPAHIPKTKGKGKIPKKPTVLSSSSGEGQGSSPSKGKFGIRIWSPPSTAAPAPARRVPPPKPLHPGSFQNNAPLSSLPRAQVLPPPSAAASTLNWMSSWGSPLTSTANQAAQLQGRSLWTSLAAAMRTSTPTSGQGNPSHLPPPPAIPGPNSSRPLPSQGQLPKISQPLPRITNTFSLSTPTASASTSNMTSPTLSGTVPIPTVREDPPQPPNFRRHLDTTLASLSTHRLFPIDNDSNEFKELQQLLSPLNITSAEQIVNPDIYQRYTTARKEMLRTKSSDLNLLSKLFPLDTDVLKAAQLSLTFIKDPLLTTEQGKFSPNEALLFHCVRDPNNLANILSQGLDERLGNQEGLFGRGIYFSDSPLKSTNYDRSGGTILIFAVLLGDCLGVSYSHNRSSLVREPEKKGEQKRGVNDKFFDSITASPSGGHNEFVIYNRFQCCPLYQVRYKGRAEHPSSGMPPYCGDRARMPVIAWRPGPTSGLSMSTPLPNQSMDGSWAFLAHSVFQRMGVLVEPPQPMDTGSGASADEQKIKALVSLGFLVEDENRAALQKYGNDLNKAVEFFMGRTKIALSQPSTSKASLNKENPAAKVPPGPKRSKNGNPASSGKAIKKAKGNPPPAPVITIDSSSEDEDGQGQPNTKKGEDRDMCDICTKAYASFDRSPKLWKELKCSHRLCLKCYKKIETTRSTMTGMSHTFVKCPFCTAITGTEVGTCPTGQMKIDIIRDKCEGYPLVPTIRITYDISTGQYGSLHRIAYLPNNREGDEINKLLQTAWDRRICFMIGTSMTTGRQNVPVWNIHHKTSTTGGPQKYGYPDPGYFQRVRDELKAYGIE